MSLFKFSKYKATLPFLRLSEFSDSLKEFDGAKKEPRKVHSRGGVKGGSNSAKTVSPKQQVIFCNMLLLTKGPDQSRGCNSHSIGQSIIPHHRKKYLQYSPDGLAGVSDEEEGTTGKRWRRYKIRGGIGGWSPSNMSHGALATCPMEPSQHVPWSPCNPCTN